MIASDRDVSLLSSDFEILLGVCLVNVLGIEIFILALFIGFDEGRFLRCYQRPLGRVTAWC